MSTSVSELVVAKGVYRNCPIMLPDRVSYVDIVELYMLDYDIILGMDWFHTFFASIECRSRVLKFSFPNERVVERKRGNCIPRGHVISYLKACKMISKGCLYHIVGVQDLDSEIPPIDSVPLVTFPRSFLMTFLVFLLNWKFILVSICYRK